MAGLFKDMLKSEESIFLNPVALDVDFQPKLVPYRENFQHYMASCMKPLFQSRTGKNLFISGPPGVGKTVSTKHVLKELEETTDELIPIYINCWKKDTAYKIILEICEQIGYQQIYNKKSDDLIKEATSILNKKCAVFVFDEIDKLIDHQIIYQLLEDVYRKCIFLITNEKDWIKNLDLRIKSRLIPEMMEFKPYNLKEIEGILKQRIDYAFIKGVWTKEALKNIVEKTFELKDMRAGLFLLKEAGSIAENESSKKVLEKHAQLAIPKLDEFKTEKPKSQKNNDAAILELIKEHNNKSTKEIYEIFKQKSNKSYRTFLRKVKNLENLGLIETDSTGNISILKFRKKD